MEQLLEILRQSIDQQMLFIHYVDLCANPRHELERLYPYLGMPYYEGHVFNNIEQIMVEDDKVYGIFGDHTIRRKVEPQPSKTLDGFCPDLCSWIRQRHGGYVSGFNGLTCHI